MQQGPDSVEIADSSMGASRPAVVFWLAVLHPGTASKP